MQPTSLAVTPAAGAASPLAPAAPALTLAADTRSVTTEQSQFLVTERGSLDCVRRESQTQRYLVAHDDGSVVGMVAVAGDAITKLYVSADRTGEGIGRSLYEAAESVIRADGHSRVTLGAFPTAVPFYARMGMAVVGCKNATGALEGLSITLMEKELHSEAV
jgi:predicted N-acetyltransferase YhbS